MKRQESGAECGCSALDTSPALMTIDQALHAITEHVSRIGRVEDVPLGKANGRILASPVMALAPSPPFDNAAMDGFAVRLTDLDGTGPIALPVSACQQAGAAHVRKLPPGTAVQIFTGALLPEGADAVIMQEQVEFTDGKALISKRPVKGENIRRAGEDMQSGDLIVRAGCRIGSREVAAIAAAGHGTVSVQSRIKVGLVSTGDEVQNPGEALQKAQIWDINSPMLAAAIEDTGAELVVAQHREDTETGLQDTLAKLGKVTDLIITTGGISVGKADYVKPALLAAGGTITFSGVAIKPGKPVSLGKLNGAVWLGLPGNPVSAFVTWSVFGSRVVECLTGQNRKYTHRRHVMTGRAACHRRGRCELRPAALEEIDCHGREVVGFPEQTGSARVSHLSNADGLILIPADTDYIPKGGMVEFLPFPQN